MSGSVNTAAPPELTRILSRFFVQTRFEDLPTPVVEQTKLSILDTIGTTVRGSRTESARLVADYVVRQGGASQASILARNTRTTCFGAAFANGCAASSLELDDGHILAHTHPGAIVVPAGLAVAEGKELPGKDLITSVLLGYDLSIRLGHAINGPRRGSLYTRSFSSSAVTGAFVSAATSAKLLGLDDEQTAHALGIAALGPGATTGGVSRSGAAVKNSFYGWPSAVGVMAAELAAMGYTADTAVLEGPMGFCQAVSDDYDLRLLHVDLGVEWSIMGIYRKRHAMCSHGHPILDGVLELMAFVGEPADVERVEIRSYRFISLLDSTRPKTVQQAMFSIPYCVATAICRKRPVLVDDFLPAAMNDAEVLAVADRVEVILDNEVELYHQEHPEERLALVSVFLRDGRRLNTRVTTARGWPENSLTPSEVVDKFEFLAGDVLGRARTGKVIEMVANLERASSVEDLIDLLR